MAGRPAKPMELKILQGTARNDRTNKSAPTYPKIKKMLAPPAQVKRLKGGAVLWRRIVKMLTTVGLLDQVNIDLIEIYVQEVITYRRAMDSVEDLGLIMINDKGAYIANPARKIASDSMKNIMAIAREFGFTPSTRQKIIVEDYTPLAITKKQPRKKQTPEDIANEFEI